ncbi:protein of unknown function [Taphrina deformans PYCC 5710]|uniref:Pyruvate decarboxylase n=1 Tax=Taphrina deformans (strain PYCC 5710 / ATCC 11124 / CBS 356.35 / IMI 108563 / JCM 9778 / NBRC 8474) TaxID=1097556 RepID=R4XGQ5_TAPDE|nr:protein of unknown function [Taphrina deformans PYCC 5710]|eukprot:CCG84848.1 protein of unknown function [Taphrina deformans PYCC 5710]
MTTTVANYLLTRLEQLGLRSVFGVPGDFNLAFLDEFDNHRDLTWVGCANELNAAYAADGYARVNHRISAIVTTFGVGELSAMNGVAGSYSEHVGVVHIVGTPSTFDQRSGSLLHHTLGNGDFSVFAKMSKSITTTQANLTDPATAGSEIDRVLQACYVRAHPVYLGIPTDMAYAEVSAKPLETKLDLSPRENEEELETYLIDEVLGLIHGAKAPIILVDACAIRHRVLDEVNQLIRRTHFPVFCTPMGKSAISEELPEFGGVYIGSITQAHIKKVVEEADLVLSVGALKSDFNTGSFSYHINKTAVVEFHSDRTQVKYATYPGVGMNSLLPKLIARIDTARTTAIPVPAFENEAKQEHESAITHDWFWPTVGDRFLRPDDVVVTETGTSNFGILDTRLPHAVEIVSQVLWGSIGFSVGALLGAAQAARERDDEAGGGRSSSRTVLFVGDGSLQLTVQEISTMIRQGLKPIIFVLNNDGYTIERFIHGPEREYNDINTSWQYQHLLEFFGAVDQKSYKVSTQDEVTALFGDGEFMAAGRIQLVEVIMGKMDAPRALKVQAELTAKANSHK